jgi:hypothetical protein
MHRIRKLNQAATPPRVATQVGIARTVPKSRRRFGLKRLLRLVIIRNP